MNATTPVQRLRLPGPVEVPERVRRAMAQPVLAHRSAEFAEILQEVNLRAKPLFGTANDIMVFASSGTGLMQAAVENTLKKGDRALVCVAGMFSSRFADVCEALGHEVDRITVPWGEAVSAEQVADQLAKQTYAAVIAVHNETSTGVVSDIEAIGACVAPTDALFIVDSISGLGGLEISQDAWSVDVLITSSQKALMCPPGAALASVSEKAWAVVEEAADKPRFYFDFRKARARAAEGQTAFTSPVSLVYALHEALTMMHEEGLPALFERHRAFARDLRAGIEPLGLPLFAKSPIVSDTVGVFEVPEGLDGKAIVKHLREEHHMVIICTKTDTGARVLRIGTMGACTQQDIAQDVAALKETLDALGWKGATTV